MSDDIIKRLRESLQAAVVLFGGRCKDATALNWMESATVLVEAASPDNIAAMLDRLDAMERENERLRGWEDCAREWLDKTEWVQTSNLAPKHLGRHRADVMRDEIERLRSAINWACGCDEGSPHFGEQPEREGAFAWRHELRRRAGMPWKVERREK